MSTDLIYRQASSGDALCLSVLATQVFLDTYATSGISIDLAKEVRSVLSTEAFLARLENPTAEIFVAEHGNYLVGFLDLQLDSPCPNNAASGIEIHRLYIQPAFQGKKIGRALMALAEDRSRAAGHKSLWLTAWAGNTAARAFYQALGYQDVGTTEYIIEDQAYENRILSKTFQECGS